MSVILFTSGSASKGGSASGRGRVYFQGDLPTMGYGRTPPPKNQRGVWAYPPPGTRKVGSAHSTGMLSCLAFFCHKLHENKRNWIRHLSIHAIASQCGTRYRIFRLEGGPSFICRSKSRSQGVPRWKQVLTRSISLHQCVIRFCLRSICTNRKRTRK